MNKLEGGENNQGKGVCCHISYAYKLVLNKWKYLLLKEISSPYCSESSITFSRTEMEENLHMWSRRIIYHLHSCKITESYRKIDQTNMKFCQW